MFRPPQSPVLASLLALAVSACEVGAGDAQRTSFTGTFYGGDAGTYAPSTIEAGATLRSAGGTSVIPLGYGEGQALSVVLDDADGDPIPGAAIRFALDGNAGGSSLRDLEVQTNADGVASTYLTAGQMTSSFSVRATASGVPAVYIPIEVSTLPTTKVQVTLSYDGAREIERYTLRAYANLSCDAFETSASVSDEVFASTEADGGATMATLRVRQTTEPLVLQLVALGPLGNVVATRCVVLGNVTGDTLPIKVGLDDTSVGLAETYPVATGLDVSVSAERMADALLLDLSELSASDPDADRMLRAIEETLRSMDAEADAAWVNGQRENLAPDLEAALATDEVGLSVSMEILAEQLREQNVLWVTGQLMASSNASPGLALSVLGVEAGPEDGDSEPLGFGTDYASVSVPATITATYDTTASSLGIDALRIELGLGSYGDALIHNLADEGGSRREGLITDAGCDVLARWAQTQTELAGRCDADCIRLACTAAFEGYLEEVRYSTNALNINHAGIALRGSLPIFDITGDGVARQMGRGDLSGSWGRATGATEPDAVVGTIDSMRAL